MYNIYTNLYILGRLGAVMNSSDDTKYSSSTFADPTLNDFAQKSREKKDIIPEVKTQLIRNNDRTWMVDVLAKDTRWADASHTFDQLRVLNQKGIKLKNSKSADAIAGASIIKDTIEQSKIAGD